MWNFRQPTNQGVDVAARHESGTGTARRALLAAVLGLALAGAAACGTNGDDTAAATPTPVSTVTEAPASEAPSPEPTVTDAPASPAPKPTAAAVANGPIVILSPAEGSGVARTFVVRGRSVSFEGTIVWQLLKADGTVATEGTAQGGADSPAPYQFTVKTPAAGTYTVRVFEESAKDGKAVHEVRRTVSVG
jgi:ABC-type phosphate transport system substrate-binding protein